MNIKNQDPRFSVYIHTSPSGKRYIGITSQRPENRWGSSGNGYKDNAHFYSAIMKYGWDSFEHEIVAENLDLIAASKLESQLISDYDAMNPDNGYNQTTGGNWSTPSPEIRDKLRKSTINLWKQPEYRDKIVSFQRSYQHKPLTEEHKRHISESLKGRVSPMKGRKWSDEQKKAIQGRSPWNAGLTKETDIRVQSISNTLKGRSFSEDTLKKMSTSRIQLYRSGYSPVWINDGNIEKQIDARDTSNLPEGFSIGRLPTIYMTDGVSTVKVSPEEQEIYESNGYVRGRSDKCNENVRKSRQVYIWTYCGNEFSSATQLAEYLNDHGYPRIVGSTITSLFLKGFENSEKYKDLAGMISREKVSR